MKTTKYTAVLIAAALAGACVPATALANPTVELDPAGSVMAATSVKAGDYAVSVTSNNKMFRPSEAVLHVGKDSAQVSFNHTGYDFVWLGTAAEYKEAASAGDVTKDKRYIAGKVTASIDSNGKLKTASRFTFDVANLNEPIDICVYSSGKKQILERRICVNCADDKKLSAAADLTITASTKGKIAWETNADSAYEVSNTPIAAKQFVAYDLDNDGKVSVEEAMKAAGEKLMDNKDAFAKYSVLKGGKLVAKSAKASVKSGEELLAFACKKASGKKADTFTTFDKTAVCVKVGQSVKLTLKGVAAKKLSGKYKLATVKGAKNISVSGIEMFGDAKVKQTKSLSKKGAVTLRFKTAGTYVVSAYGTTATGSAIIAPACVVTVA